MNTSLLPDLIYHQFLERSDVGRNRYDEFGQHRNKTNILIKSTVNVINFTVINQHLSHKKLSLTNVPTFYCNIYIGNTFLDI